MAQDVNCGGALRRRRLSLAVEHSVRSGSSASATGASESLASAAVGAIEASGEFEGASGALAAGSSRFGSTGLPAFPDAWTSAPTSLAGAEASGSNTLVGAAKGSPPFASGTSGGASALSVGANSRGDSSGPAALSLSRTAGLKLARRPQGRRLRRPPGQPRPRSPRPARQSRDSPRIRADGRTWARPKARSAGADQAPRAATRG